MLRVTQIPTWWDLVQIGMLCLTERSIRINLKALRADSYAIALEVMAMEANA